VWVPCTQWHAIPDLAQVNVCGLHTSVSTILRAGHGCIDVHGSAALRCCTALLLASCWHCMQAMMHPEAAKRPTAAELADIASDLQGHEGMDAAMPQESAQHNWNRLQQITKGTASGLALSDGAGAGSSGLAMSIFKGRATSSTGGAKDAKRRAPDAKCSKKQPLKQATLMLTKKA
jgi:hypothetical protein